MQLISKVGLVPYVREGGCVHVLLHKPRPKRNAADDVPYGLCRGTRRFLDAEGAWQDMRKEHTLAMLAAKDFEPLWHCALREGREELGVTEEQMGEVVDCGVLEYYSERNGVYPIHWFACAVSDPECVKKPLDASAVAWVTLEEARAMAEQGRFKVGYVPILEAILQQVGR